MTVIKWTLSKKRKILKEIGGIMNKKSRITWLIVIAIILIISIVGLSIVLFGVSKEHLFKPVKETTTSTVSKTDEDINILLISHFKPCPFWAVVKKGMDGAANQLGIDASIYFSYEDISKQVAILEQAIASDVDGIAISIVNPDAFDPAIKEAIDAGIPIVAFNNDDPEGAKGNARLAFIGQDMTQAGYELGKRIAKVANLGSEDLVVIPAENPGEPYAILRSNGVKKALDEVGASYEILDAGGIDTSINEQRITSYILAHPELKAIVAVGGQVTEVTGRVVEKLNYKPGEIPAGGFDIYPETLTAIEKGYIEAIVDQQPYLQGYYAVQELYLMVKYGFGAYDIDTGKQLVDINNIGTVKKLIEEDIWA